MWRVKELHNCCAWTIKLITKFGGEKFLFIRVFLGEVRRRMRYIDTNEAGEKCLHRKMYKGLIPVHTLSE